MSNREAVQDVAGKRATGLKIYAVAFDMKDRGLYDTVNVAAKTLEEAIIKVRKDIDIAAPLIFVELLATETKTSS